MIHFIDARHLEESCIIGCGILHLDDKDLAMIDCGPESVFENVVYGLQAQQLDPARIKHLFLTHVHLDHAGGAWKWAKEFGTTVYVHPVGAPHLIDPSRLLTSARQIYGEKMEFLWGQVEAIPESQLQLLEDKQELVFAEQTLQAIYTPGHARHHNAYWLDADRTLFTGDVAGVAIEGGPVIPPCPPPDIVVETWRESIQKVRSLQPRAFYATHFGRLDQPEARLQELEKRLRAWAEWMRHRMRQGKRREEILTEFEDLTREELRAAGLSEAQCARYEHANPAFMSVAGLMRYWTKYHPEALA
jgi:glyoxylase-like metal-dependent hydrolase (beta-lactamase superfamily II)